MIRTINFLFNERCKMDLTKNLGRIAQTANLDLPRSSMLALWGGILFSLAFTGLIYWAGQRLAMVPHLQINEPAWYYWRLPSPTFWGRLTAWGFYILHQVALWGVIYYAQSRIGRYKKGLHPINLVAMGVNVFFILLHFVQTHIWYDGLAQDVSVFSSQGSVIVLLVWVLLMENSRRGMIFGKKLPISQQINQFARKYHGYFFAWATVYTFWYHPMENTLGHLVGFFYMFLLLLQGSLFFTRIHINRWWTLVQEVTVGMHGTLVALMQGGALWPMFAFGFGGIFVITQMHGLSLPAWLRGAILAVYAGAVIWVYSARGWGKLNEIMRIPLIDYLAVLVMASLFGLILWAWRRIQSQPASQTI